MTRLFWFQLILPAMASAVVLTPRDTVDVYFVGDAAATFQAASGPRAVEAGLVRGTYRHRFSPRVTGNVAMTGSRTIPALPTLEEASLRFTQGQSSVRMGVLSDRYGCATPENAYSTFSPLFERPVLWNASGFGLAWAKSWGALSTESAAMINYRESGAARVSLHGSLGPLNGTLLAGLITYSPELQDNEFTGGFELQARWPVLTIHSAAKVSLYQGYGSETNPTMTPGWLSEALVECTVVPARVLKVNTMFYAQRQEKRFMHDLLHGKVRADLIFREHLGFGAGLEMLDADEVTTVAPTAGLLVVPVPGHAKLEVSGRRSTTGESSPSYTLGANLWIAF